ncbi:hypothetical protein DFR29_1219 [Tahibacter aquaticus]|uniref:Uncharacterized protein n=1 Tax=Tahibacter aquaticus TaxID=520092 RepID=A0A4R6YLY3_9GAMM|nr:DUF411 domain-containing protein [Tahibacter aquaticus]TDR38337.1 hypothetical protein DFR29_1219 [Tahibacter aquaticus]
MTRRTDPRSSAMTQRSPVRRRPLALPVLAGVGAAGLVVLAALLVLARGMPVRSEITVFRRPGCVCCLAWVARLREAGFRVAVQDEPHLDAVRLRLGVPENKASCHTALTREGYVIEGHVPPQDVRRWLQERPPLRPGRRGHAGRFARHGKSPSSSVRRMGPAAGRRGHGVCPPPRHGVGPMKHGHGTPDVVDVARIPREALCCVF